MNTMLSKALREFTAGPLNQLIVNLGGQDGSQWEEELRRFLRKEPCWKKDEIAQVIIPDSQTNLLGFFTIIVVHTNTDKFVAKEKFVINSERNGRVLINFLDNNFRSWFLFSYDKTEDPIPELCSLRFAALLKVSVDAPIIDELGGEEKVETTLPEVFSLMEKQKRGESGVLLNNGLTNIFYIKNLAGILWTISVYWSGGGWRISADPIGFHKWDAGCQVFSRFQ